MSKTKKRAESDDEEVSAPLKGHSDLYWAVRRLVGIVDRERRTHPRTKVWKDLEKLAWEMDEIQRDWFLRHRR